MSAMSDAIGVLLAGGQGERLWPLTRDRAKPAVPFGALYRIIDITLSNCINSDLRRVFRSDPIQSAEPQPACPRGMVAAGWARRLYRGAYAADARLEGVVSGHGRRRLSEHLFDRERAIEVRFYSFRRPHLQNELRQDAEAACGFSGGRDGGHHPDSGGGGREAIRRD